MTTTTNIQMNTNTGPSNEKGNSMKHSMFLAPLLSEKIITMFVLGYLAMVTAILLMTANPLQSPASLDFGPRSVSASTLDATGDLKTVVVEIPEVRVPAAPYIIVGQAN